MSIKRLVVIAAASLLGILCLGGLLASSRINTIRIGGPIQTNIQLVSDLVADILPPPEYVLEPFFEATVLLREPGQYALHAKRLTQLQADYDGRHAYWAASSLDPELRKSIVEGSHAPAQKFWTELNESFLPAVKLNDVAAINASYRRLGEDYAQQRAMVDRTVALAATYQAALKAYSDTQLIWTVGLLGGLGLAILILVGGACVGLMRHVIQPLIKVVDATTTLAAGGHADVPHLDRSDELGQMAIAIESFRLSAIARADSDERLSAEQQLVTTSLGAGLAALKEGDLTVDITADFPPAYVELKTNFSEAVSSLRNLIGAVGESAEGIRTGSSEIAQASEDLARRTEINAASLEQTSAALVQIDGRLKATAVAAGRTVERADQAISTVGVGRVTAEEAVAAMVRVSGSAKGIASVIEGVDKIAFQTRVLAMNAAVEAGRAGDAGRGFAVVADLVSALAMRAEEEAKRARDQLTVTQTDIVTAVEAVQKVDGALANISGDVGEVHKLLGSMAVDNQAQSSAITEISAAIGTMDQSTQQNAAMVEQTSAAARNLTTEVGALAEHAAMFKVDGSGRHAAAPPARLFVVRPTMPAVDTHSLAARRLPTRPPLRVIHHANGNADGAAVDASGWSDF